MPPKRQKKQQETQFASTAEKEEVMPPKRTKKTSTPVDIQKLVSEAAFPEPQAPAVKTKKPAAPKKAAPAQGAAPAAVKGPYIVIDYPTEGEKVSGLSYTMKIGASGEGRVEVQVNNGDWKPARHGGGYWWFDWGYYKPGPHTITAQLVSADGKVLKKTVRKCTVK